MFRNLLENLRRFDWLLLVAVFFLFCLGLTAIYSVGLSETSGGFSNFKKQIIFGVIGFLLLFAFGLGNYSSLRVYNRLIYIVTLVSILAVLFFGSVVRGTRGWFMIFGLGIQPVELAKICLTILLAKFFSNRLHQFRVTKHVLASLLLTLTLAIPILLQPDLGSAAILFGVWFLLLLIIGLEKKYLIIIIIALLVLGTFAWALLLHDYQRERILTFINPTADPLGSGYNVAQSIIAVGSGYFWGRGLGFGSQSQLKFIPESQTDFIFAVIAEELGFFGVLLILGLWGLVFYRLIVIARKARDDFGLFVVLGIAIILFLHMFINIGMNVGIMPVTGISLPFLSYGGSFLVASLVMIGITQSVAIRR